MTRTLIPLAFVVLITLLIGLMSCGDDPPPNPPVVSLDQTAVNAKVGDLVTAVVSATLDGKFLVLRITKYNENSIDSDFGTGGISEVGDASDPYADDSGTLLPYTHFYTVLASDSAFASLRFNYEVEDMNNLTGEADLIITVE